MLTELRNFWPGWKKQQVEEKGVCALVLVAMFLDTTRLPRTKVMVFLYG